MSSAEMKPRWSMQPEFVVLVLVLLFLLFIAALVGALILPLSEVQPPKYSPTAGIRALAVILGPGTGDNPFFDNPMGAAFGKDGRIYVADTGNNRIVAFDSDASYLFQFGGLGVGKPAAGGRYSWKPGRFNYPTDVAVDDNGDVYVADFRNDQVQVFDASGKFLKVFPDRMKRVGKGASGQDGTGIAVTSLTVNDGRVYATDKYQVLVFDVNGELLGQFGKPGAGPADFDHPSGVTVTLGDMVVVSDSNHNRVVALTPAGGPLWSVGTRRSSATSEQAGEFEVPRGLTRSDDGSIIVSDALACRLVKLSATGEVLGRFGQRGMAPGELNFPTDVDAQGGRLVVAEKGGNRVQILALEEK